MSYSWDLPYRSNRSPLFAQNIVASSQPLAVQAGLETMRMGGNAVDAALATAITLTVVEPNNNGIGSDAFAIVHDGKELRGLNASGRSPGAWSPTRFSQLNAMPSLGWDSVTVPGAVSAWVAMSDKFGKLPFKQLFEPAIHYAEQGYQVGPQTGLFWKLAERTYAGYEEFSRTFLPEGRAPEIGESIRLPNHAASLRLIAATKGDAFYRGELARAMISDSVNHGGAMTLDDLASHKVDWVTPVAQAYSSGKSGGISLHEIPPSGQGLMALIALGILEHLQLASYPLDSSDSLHLQIEAMRSAYAEIKTHLADIDHMQVTSDQLLNTAYLQSKAAAISLERATSNPPSLPSNPDTVYLTTADQNGMMVSMIQSNYRGFGSGIVVPETGISLQDRGSGFSLEAGHPNEVGGGKRPYHTIIPGFVTQGEKPLMSFGVMGGHMQAQGHVQMIVRMFDYAQNPQAASDAPRWRLTEDGRVALESGFDPQVISNLKKRGHDIVPESPHHLFGGAQLIVKMKQGYCGASDHRKEGLAAGF